jgi:Transglycosylase SLT domain
MLLELALATAIHKTNPSLSPKMVESLAHTVVQESEDKGLDPWMFFAIVKQESWWVPTAIHRYRKGHRYQRGSWCDVGLGQVHVQCRSKEILPLLNPERNLHRSAQIQQEAMMFCHQNACEKGWLFLYNHSSTYVVIVQKEAEEARHEFAPEVWSPRTP